MKFSIALSDLDLENLLKTLAPRPKGTDAFTLSACAARVFVECKGDIGGIEALVFEDGAVVLPTKASRELLKTYKGRKSLTLEGSPDGLCIGTFRMRVAHYSPNPKPPGNFQVFGTVTPPAPNASPPRA
jgi:hypothetical protein